MLPISSFAQQRHGRETTAAAERVVVFVVQASHHREAATDLSVSVVVEKAGRSQWAKRGSWSFWRRASVIWAKGAGGLGGEEGGWGDVRFGFGAWVLGDEFGEV